MTADPVRVRRLFRRWMSLPREALRLSSGPASKCLEFRFYNRRFASRAPAETPPSETVRRATVGKPTGVRLPDPPRNPAFPRSPRKTPDHLAVIRPPTAARLTAHCRLRADRLPPCFALSRGAERALRPCQQKQRLRRCVPSDTSLEATCRKAAGATLCLPPEPVPAGGTSMPPTFPSPRCLPPEKTSRAPLRAPAPCHWPVGQRVSRRTPSSMFENID
jgi:hypothetical protein